MEGVTAVAGPTRVLLRQERAGVWAGVWPYPEIPDYRLDVTGNGSTSRVDDPCRFAPSPRPPAEPGG